MAKGIQKINVEPQTPSMPLAENKQEPIPILMTICVTRDGRVNIIHNANQNDRVELAENLRLMHEALLYLSRQIGNDRIVLAGQMNESV